MMMTSQVSQPLHHNSAITRALDSLWAGDTEVVAEIVEATSGEWLVQTGDDYDGYLFMLIEPRSENANSLPSYLISGKTGRLELAAIYGDECQTLGRFSELSGLVSELTARLVCGARRAI